MSSVRVDARAATEQQAPRPPRAVVGSQIEIEEEIFAAFDGHIIRRFWGFIRPHHRWLTIAVAGRAGVRGQSGRDPTDRARGDRSMRWIEGATGERFLTLGALIFLAIVSVNFVANLVQETLVGRIAERLLIHLRRAMYAHLQDRSRCRSWTRPRSDG